MSHLSEPPIIDWTHPEPQGWLERFIGAGATPAEVTLQLLPTLLFSTVALLYLHLQGSGWAWWQSIIAWLLLADLIGGVVTNSTSSAKRWYHRAERPWRQHLGFVVLHALQPLVVVLAFERSNWLFFGLGFGYLFLASLLLLATPLYLQRPLSGLLVVMGIFIGLHVISPPPGFAWFLPVYYLKILNAHLLREEPYRPAARAELSLAPTHRSAPDEACSLR